MEAHASTHVPPVVGKKSCCHGDLFDNVHAICTRDDESFPFCGSVPVLNRKCIMCELLPQLGQLMLDFRRCPAVGAVPGYNTWDVREERGWPKVYHHHG